MVSSNNLTSHIIFLVHVVHIFSKKSINCAVIDSILLSKVAFDLGVLQIVFLGGFFFFSPCALPSLKICLKLLSLMNWKMKGSKGEGKSNSWLCVMPSLIGC